MRSQRGLSFIELIIFIVVVSVGIVGILSVLNVTVKSSTDPLIRKQSISIAEAMLSEVLAKSFSVVGTPVTSRKDFDDISDYDNYSETPILTINNDVDVGLGNYAVTVTIDNTSHLNIPAGDIKQVSVTVVGGGNTITLIGYRTKY